MCPSLASLFNLSGSDLFVILLIVLLLFGAKRLPDLAKGMSDAIREFARAREEFEERLRQCGDHLEEPQREGFLVTFNRLLVPLAIVILLLAAWVWLSGR